MGTNLVVPKHVDSDRQQGNVPNCRPNKLWKLDSTCDGGWAMNVRVTFFLEALFSHISEKKIRMDW